MKETVPSTIEIAQMYGRACKFYTVFRLLDEEIQYKHLLEEIILVFGLSFIDRCAKLAMIRPKVQLYDSKPAPVAVLPRRAPDTYVSEAMHRIYRHVAAT